MISNKSYLTQQVGPVDRGITRIANAHFQQVLFNPTGRAGKLDYETHVAPDFQQVLFNPTGRDFGAVRAAVGISHFQQVLFNPTGREFVSEAIASKGFKP